MVLKLGDFQSPKKASNPSIQIPNEAPAIYKTITKKIKMLFLIFEAIWGHPLVQILGMKVGSNKNAL